MSFQGRMVQHKAHDVADRPRTEDIHIKEEIDFKSMLLPKPILQGLNKSGYKKPSPIQKQALPLVRCGMDLIVQAKAGTGKTCVFALAALEMVKPNLPHLQAVVLAPTREIALQITDVIRAVGSQLKGLKTSCFIGGYPVDLDKEKAHRCQIAVGTPGRMRYLIKKMLEPNHVRLFVLDEADKLMEPIFVKDINAIYASLPTSKQVLACSATYTPQLVEFLSRYMHRGQYVSPQSSSDSTVLLGVRQFVSLRPHHVDKLATLRLKEKRLLDLLSSVVFDQCLVFSNLHSRAESVCETLRKEGWGVEWIAGRQAQQDRVAALAQLKEQKVRVLVTTDLTARGIDVENVNLIINLDLPLGHEVYLHRMGRAGRFGSHGMVITIISEGKELESFQQLLGKIGGTSLAVNVVPEKLKEVDLWTIPDSELKKIQGVLVKATSKESDDSTDTDEKLSKASSDDELSDTGAIEKAAQDMCDCGLFEVKPDSIEVLSRQSLFTVLEKSPNWREVLPVVVNESKLPLNTKLTLLGSKVIRVKAFSENLDASSSKHHDVVEESISFDKSFHIDFETDLKTSPKILSFNEIKEALETGTTPECKVETHDESKCFTYHEELKRRFQEFQLSKEKVENSLKSFNSFDLVAWMAVDEKENILENLKLDKSNVYRFDIVKCPSNKNHIKVVNSFEKTEAEEDHCHDSISVLNLEEFNFKPPISLTDIVKSFKNLKENNVSETKDKIARIKTKSEINNSIGLEQELEEKENDPKGFENNQRGHNNVVTNKIKTNGLDTRLKNGLYNKTKINTQLKPQEAPTIFLFKRKQKAVKKIVKESVKSTNKLEVSSPVTDISCSKSSEYLSQSSSTESDVCSSKLYQEPLDKYPITNGQSHLSSSKESGPSMAMSKNHKCKESRVIEESESDKNSDSDESPYSDESSDSDQYSASDKYSASDNSSESETFEASRSKQAEDSYPSSSDCSYEIANEKTTKDCCIKLKRNCKNKDKTHQSSKHTTIHNVTSESYDSLESEASNCHSYKTASLETVRESPDLHELSGKSGKSCKEDLDSQASCSYTQKPIKSPTSHLSVKTESRAKRTEVTKKSKLSSAPRSNEYCSKNTSNTYYNFDQHMPQDYQTNQEKLFNKPTPSNPKILTSNNLIRDWYSTWYTEVRRRARQLEYMDYVNTMLSRR